MPRSLTKKIKRKSNSVLRDFDQDQRLRIRQDVGLMRGYMNRIYSGGPEVFGAGGGTSNQMFTWGKDHSVTLTICIAPKKLLKSDTPAAVESDIESIPFSDMDSDTENPVSKDLETDDWSLDNFRNLKPTPLPAVSACKKRVREEKPEPGSESESESEAESGSESESKTMAEADLSVQEPEAKVEVESDKKKSEYSEESVLERLNHVLDLEEKKEKEEAQVLARLRRARRNRQPLPPTPPPSPEYRAEYNPAFDPMNPQNLETLPQLPGRSQYSEPGKKPEEGRHETYQSRVQKRQFAHVPLESESHGSSYLSQGSQSSLAPTLTTPVARLDTTYSDPRILQAYSSSGVPTMRLKTV